MTTIYEIFMTKKIYVYEINQSFSLPKPTVNAVDYNR